MGKQGRQLARKHVASRSSYSKHRLKRSHNPCALLLSVMVKQLRGGRFLRGGHQRGARGPATPTFVHTRRLRESLTIPLCHSSFRTQGAGAMRRNIQRASRDVSTRGAHTISFQISNGAARFACSVIAHAPSREHAVELFQYNWQCIERAARECLADAFFEGNEIRLVMA